jgi:putative toxin-antitoxin system antitoxin component (TIGR02293 family)
MARAMTRDVVEVLGGPGVIGRGVRTPEDFARRLRRGLPYAALEALLGALGVPREMLAETLRLPLRTLARRKRERRLLPEESDRLYRMARVFARARAVLGDRARAASWLCRPNRALGGEVPVQLLDTDIGVQRVDEILGRIEHGVVS